MSESYFQGAHNFNIYDSRFHQTTVYNITNPAMPKAPPGHIQGMTLCPVPTNTFTGREEALTKLEEFFRPGSAAERKKTFLLYGLGGAGKTQLALEFAKRFKESFTAIFFITAYQEDSIQRGYADIAKTSGAQNAQSWEVGLNWLRIHKENWLIVFDNADNPKIPLIKYSPSCDHGNIIITSRNPGLRNIADQILKLSGMSPKEGIQLLVKHAFQNLNRISDQQKKVAAEIAKELHYFPLALVQAGIYIDKQDSLFEYLDRMGEQREKLLSKDPQQPKDQYYLSVYKTWNLSWKQLSPDTKFVLGSLAHLHYEHIPHALFERGVKNLRSMTESPLGPSKAVTKGKLILQRIATAKMDLNVLGLDKIMNDAASYSLINKKSNEYMFHPFVHQWLKDTVKEHHRQAMEGIVVLAIGNISWERFGLSWEDREFFLRLLPHVRVLGDSVISDYVVKFAFGHIWWKLNQFNEAIMMWGSLLDIMIDRLGLAHGLTLYHEYQMAQAYTSSGKHNEALELQQKLIATSKSVLGDQHPATLSRTQNLALTLAVQRRTDEALELQQSLLESSKRIMGEEHPATLHKIQKLAITLKSLGRTNEALELEKRLLETSKRVLGVEYPDTLSITQELAVTLRVLGRTRDALELEQSLLETSKRVLKEEHPDTDILNTIQNLAERLRDLGRTNEALELEHNLLETSKRILGEEHPDTLHKTQNLAIILKSVGKTNEALELEQSLLETSKRVLGVEHPDTLSVTQNLAVTLRVLGRTKEALELEQSLLETSKKVLGVEHPDTLNRTQNLAITLQSLGKTDEALELKQSLLETSKRLLGEEHPDILSYTQNLAITLKSLGRTNEAFKLVHPLIQSSKQILGITHPGTLSIALTLALTIRALGQFGKAFSLLQTLVGEYEAHIGPEHPETLTVTQHLAGTLLELGRTQEALQLQQSILVTSQRVFSLDHPVVMTAKQTLAITYTALGNHNSALQLQQP